MLETVKLILQVSNKDDLLVELLSISLQKVLIYLNVTQLPMQLEWIVIELTVQRYNRIGSEGMSSESVDGGSTSYIEDELAPYYQLLDVYKQSNVTDSTVNGYKLF